MLRLVLQTSRATECSPDRTCSVANSGVCRRCSAPPPNNPFCTPRAPHPPNADKHPIWLDGRAVDTANIDVKSECYLCAMLLTDTVITAADIAASNKV